jgi:hypothetical protein
MLLDVKGEVPISSKRGGNHMNVAAQVRLGTPVPQLHSSSHGRSYVDVLHGYRAYVLSACFNLMISQVTRRVQIAARPKAHRKPPNRRARAATAAACIAASATTAAKQARSRPGELALAELHARANSQWALLDQEAACREAAEVARRREELRRRQRQLDADISAQLAVKAEAAAAEAAAKREERAAVLAEVARQEAEERQAAERRHAAMLAVKADRERQVAEARVGRRVADRLRKQMEQQELADIQAAQKRIRVGKEA